MSDLQIQARSSKPTDWKAKFEAEQAEKAKLLAVLKRLCFSLDRVGKSMEVMKEFQDVFSDGFSVPAMIANGGKITKMIPRLMPMQEVISTEMTDHIGPLMDTYLPYFQAQEQHQLTESNTDKDE